jgi:hypothetical protein
MATIADFVGTWYFRGDRNASCTIQLRGPNKLQITDEKHQSYPGHLEGDNWLVSENPSNYGIRGSLSSDARQIAWTNGEVWTR